VLSIVSLTESDAAIFLVDFDAEVAHLESPLHLGLEGPHLRFFLADDDEVIDVDAH
jgi:hypothetical protein